jgi:hypothetical protein
MRPAQMRSTATQSNCAFDPLDVETLRRCSGGQAAIDRRDDLAI